MSLPFVPSPFHHKEHSPPSSTMQTVTLQCHWFQSACSCWGEKGNDSSRMSTAQACAAQGWSTAHSAVPSILPSLGTFLRQLGLLSYLQVDPGGWVSGAELSLLMGTHLEGRRQTMWAAIRLYFRHYQFQSLELSI